MDKSASKISKFKLADLTIAHVFVGTAFVAAIFASSWLVDLFMTDAKANYMCRSVYEKDGQAEVDACLQREADRQVAAEK